MLTNTKFYILIRNNVEVYFYLQFLIGMKKKKGICDIEYFWIKNKKI